MPKYFPNANRREGGNMTTTDEHGPDAMQYYPTSQEIDHWCRDLVEEADRAPLSAELLSAADAWPFTLGVRHHEGHCYVKFTAGEEVFYGFWQPALSGGPAPLLVHLPGYGAEMSAHPELVTAGFNVLHINPLGYNTPDGPDASKRPQGEWPVLPDTAATFGEHGYRDFLRHALLATRWAQALACVQADRLGVFGSSQGGGTALLTASLLNDRGMKAVAADVTALTNYPLVHELGVDGSYTHFALKDVTEQRLPDAWRALGYVDTLSHAHRLTMPVLLTGAGLDTNTPIPSIRSLFDNLPGTRSYTEIAGQQHRYSPLFLQLAKAWFVAHV